TADLMFASRVQGAAARRGIGLDVAMSTSAALEKGSAAAPYLAIIDLTLPKLDIERTVADLHATFGSQLTIVAFGPHVQHEHLAAAENAGCDRVLTRGQFNATMDAVLAEFRPGA